MRSSFKVFRAAAVVSALLVPAHLGAHDAAGQVVSWISPTSGLWNQPSRWSSNPQFPNNNEWDIVLPGTAAYTVTLDAPTSVRIASLSITNPNATLLQTAGITLGFDDFMNIQAGTYSLNSATLLLGVGIGVPAPATNAGQLNLLNSQMRYAGPATSTFHNTGTITATNSSIEVAQLRNSGTIQLSNSSLVLKGDTTLDQLNNVSFLSNSLLRVEGDIDLQGQNVAPSQRWEIAGGSVSNGTISLGTAPAVRVVFDLNGADSFFHNVFVNAPITVNATRLTLDEDSRLAPGLTLKLEGSQLFTANPLDDGVQILTEGNCTVSVPSIEPGVTVIRGNDLHTTSFATVNRGLIIGQAGTVRLSNSTNYGVVSAQGSGVSLSGHTYNYGTISMTPSAILTLAGQWRNFGTISITGGHIELMATPIASSGTFLVVDTNVNVRGPITSAALQSVLNGGTNNIVAVAANGTLINGGTTTSLDMPWQVRDQGRISGGTLLSAAANGRIAIPQTITPVGQQPKQFGAIFDDVRIGAPIDVANGATLSLVNSTLLQPSAITVNAGGTFTYVDLASSTIAGEIVVNDSTQGNRAIIRGSGVTIAPDGVIRTGNSGGSMNPTSGGFGSFGINNGRIIAQTPGATLSVGSLSNDGTIIATNGGTLEITTGVLNTGALEHGGGTINLRGTTHWLPGGTLSMISGGGAINVYNGLNLNNTTITLSSATGPLNLRGGSVTQRGTFDSIDSTAVIMRDGIGTLSDIAMRGEVLVQPPAVLVMAGTWSNSGNIVADSATVSLRGNYTTADFANIRAIGGTISFEAGTLNNAGSTLALNLQSGYARLDQGTIAVGTIAASEGAKLNVRGFGTLSSVTSTAPIMVHASATVNVVNGMTLLSPGNLTTNAATNSSNIQFRGTQTIQGNGEIVFEGLTNSGTIGVTSGTLTIAPGITIRSGAVGGNLAAGSGIFNQGLISSQTPQAGFVMTGALTNLATVEAINAGSITISSSTASFNNIGTLRASDGGRIQFVRPTNLAVGGTLTGGTWIVDNFSTMTFTGGSITVNNGATIALSGGNSLFNALAPLAVNAGTISFDAGYRFASVGTLSNSGKIVIGNDSAIRVKNALHNSGTIDINGVLLAEYAAAEPSPLPAFQQQIVTGRNGGAWDGPGLTSSAARNAVPPNLTLGIMESADYLAIYGVGATLGGFEVLDDMILVRSTYYGDTDFNGIVNFDDYSRIDTGFNNGLSGWLNGDFDLNDAVNFDDYALIDLAFNSQSGTLARAAAFLSGEDRSARAMNYPALVKIHDHFAQFGEPFATSFLAAIPEPVSAVFILMSGALRRPRRSHRGLRM